VHGRQRPDAATRIVDRLKLHRYRVRLRGRDYTVITLRPGTDAHFSTNYFHGTWHILSDWHGARLLGRLLWGLAFQRVPSTLVLVDRPFLDSNPFDAEAPDPIAFVPAPLTSLSHKAARELRERLPLRAGHEGTVRWQTYGLAAAVAARRAVGHVSEARPVWIPPRGFQERMDRVGGLVTLTAVPKVLMVYAAYIYTLGDYHQSGTAYAEVDWPNGEVQVFRDYRRRVVAARVARREVLAERADRPDRDTLNPLIWQRGHDIRHRARRPIAPPPPPPEPAASVNESRWPGPTPYGRIPPDPAAAA
jgi:hypothetical protein